MSNLGLTWQINDIIHPSFIEGRVGKIEVNNAEVGIVGEINPAVLNNWKLENPVAAFEIQIQRILEIPLEE